MIPAGLAGTLPLQAGAEAVGKAAEYQFGDQAELLHATFSDISTFGVRAATAGHWCDRASGRQGLQHGWSPGTGAARSHG